LINSLRTDVFLEKFRKYIFPENGNGWTKWLQQKVLSKCFPKNGNVGIFRQS
jgi:hypothetical protein